MNSSTFKNIGIIGRLGSVQVYETVERLANHLTSAGLNVILDSALKGNAEDSSGKAVASLNAEILSKQTRALQTMATKKMGEACDLVVVVGGDGCMLGAGRDLARTGVPVVGVNRGNLGFLTDISPSEAEAGIDGILRGEYSQQPRTLLEAEVARNGEGINEGVAVNDIVVHPGQAVQMIEFDLYIDGEFVYTQKSDGLIVATPTGSTAYALSAGGPIMHPGLDALAVVPMFPHMLTSRPIVVSGSSEIKVKLRENRSNVNPQVSFDGQPSVQARPYDIVYIRKMPNKLNLIHPTGHDFYETCRSKLGWSRHLGSIPADDDS